MRFRDIVRHGLLQNIPGRFRPSYLNEFSDKNYFGHGETLKPAPVTGVLTNTAGDLRTNGVYFDFAYSFTDKLAMSASIPFLARKYNPDNNADPYSDYGARHKLADGSVPLDDGRYHGSFQDIGLRLRYNLTARPFMITPYVEYNTPSHDYLFFSHAIVGNHVKSLGIGSYFGAAFDRALPNSYVQSRFGYTFDEKILDISRNRIIGDVEFGYFFTPSVRAFTILAGECDKGRAEYRLPRCEWMHSTPE